MSALYVWRCTVFLSNLLHWKLIGTCIQLSHIDYPCFRWHLLVCACKRYGESRKYRQISKESALVVAVKLNILFDVCFGVMGFIRYWTVKVSFRWVWRVWKFQFAIGLKYAHRLPTDDVKKLLPHQKEIIEKLQFGPDDIVSLNVVLREEKRIRGKLGGGWILDCYYKAYTRVVLVTGAGTVTTTGRFRKILIFTMHCFLRWMFVA